MDEHYGLAGRKDDVWTAGQAGLVNPETEATTVQGAPKLQFRLCVLSANPGHHPGTGGGIDNVDHNSSWLFLRRTVESSDLDKDPRSPMARHFKVVDLFAGPGGLAEGFSACRRPDGTRPFQVAMSVEKEPSAHRTLRLRAFLRQFDSFPDAYYQALNRGLDQPDWTTLFRAEWRAAEHEAQRLELGVPEHNAIVEARIDALRQSTSETVVIGGPPCQAYSLVGRARNQGTAGYRAEEDHRHFLYREYISILRRLTPAAFVMENVKGLISSSVGGERILERILTDLRNAGGRDSYVLLPLGHECAAQTLFGEAVQQPRDFVLEAERFGVPQARHRVIIVGIRKDVFIDRNPDPGQSTITPAMHEAQVQHVLGGLPKLRSGLSEGEDGDEEWRRHVMRAIDSVSSALSRSRAQTALQEGVGDLRKAFIAGNQKLSRSSASRPSISKNCPSELISWLVDRQLKRAPNHETRGHMDSDLARYFFCSAYAQILGRSPKASDFPKQLAPRHANWTSGKFEDRFRVQVANAPSTTITSHISKDGHYFIHPDPLQCRSLTVREAARLQTFPDNYLFLGNRTQQYIQVGNAVPPLLARQIADVLLNILEGKPRARTTGSRSDRTRTLA
jgi:DNA (cytosine-5)-methyltransferase 1